MAGARGISYLIALALEKAYAQVKVIDSVAKGANVTLELPLHVGVCVVRDLAPFYSLI